MAVMAVLQVVLQVVLQIMPHGKCYDDQYIVAAYIITRLVNTSHRIDANTSSRFFNDDIF